MNLYKRLLSAALAIALCTQLSFAVMAESETVTGSNTSVEQTNVDDSTAVDITEENITDESQNDVIDENNDESESEIFTETPYDDSINANTSDPNYKTNDPGYLKYIYNSRLSRAAYGSGNLTHQSRFATAEKQYGIDVSVHNGTINWTNVKNSDVEYVIIRVGYRGYGSAGTLVVDDNFYSNIKGAKAAGLKVGVYFYTQAVNTAEAKAEANYVLDAIKGYSLDLPVYYDIEGVDYATGRLDSAGLSKAQKTALCTAFCDTIENAGYTAGVYSNLSWLYNEVDGASLGQKYKIWLAHFATSTWYANTFDIWQYSSTGSVSGISGNVDMNVKYITDHHPQGDLNLKYTTNGTTAKLSWDKVENNVGYIVFRENSAGVSERVKVIKSTSTTSYSFTLPSTSYKYYVRAYNTYNSKNYYGEFSSKLTILKGQPGNLAVSSYSQNSVLLNWDAVKNADGYLIYARRVGSKNYYLKAKVTTNSGIAGNLTSGVFYAFRVRAYYTDGTSTQFISGTSTKSIFSSPCTQPTKAETGSGLTSSGYSSSSITLKWNKAERLCDGYQIAYYNASSKSYSIIGTTTNISYTVSGLNSGTSYSFAVMPYFKYKTKTILGEYSTYFTTSTSPANVTTLSLLSFHSNSALVSWNSVTGATSYQIYQVKNGSYVYVKSVNTTSTTIDNLTVGSTYSYCIRPVRYANKYFYGGYGNTITFNLQYTTPSYLNPDSTYSATSTSISWASVIGATSYQVYQLDESTNSYKLKSTINKSTTRCTISGLTSSTGYTYKVRAVYGSSYSAFTNEVKVYTKPDVPENFRTITTSSNFLRLQWDTVPNANYYRIYIYNSSTKKYEIYKDVHSYKVRITDLSPSTTYKFKIKAIIDAKKNYLSNYSTVLSSKTSS